MPVLTLRAHKRPIFRHAGVVIGDSFAPIEVSDEQAAELRRCVELGLIRERRAAAPNKPNARKQDKGRG